MTTQNHELMRAQDQSQSSLAGHNGQVDQEASHAENIFSHAALFLLAFGQQLDSHFKQIKMLASVLPEKLTGIESQIMHLRQALDAFQKENSGTANSIAQIEGRCTALSYNLEQVRLLNERLAGKHDELVNDFIERQVTDNLFKEFARIHSSLQSIPGNGDPAASAEIKAIAEDIERFLDAAGLHLINPQMGDVLNPREHQPVKMVDAINTDLAGKIAGTFNPGLSREHRVVLQARVAVFKPNQ